MMIYAQLPLVIHPQIFHFGGDLFSSEMALINQEGAAVSQHRQSPEESAVLCEESWQGMRNTPYRVYSSVFLYFRYHIQACPGVLHPDA